MTLLAGDPAKVRALAAMILRLGGGRLGEGAQALLADLERYDGARPLSTRQLEALHSLREQTSHSERAGRYRAADLVRRVWELRLDLDEDDEAWLDEIKARGADLALSRAEWRRLLAICRRPEIDLLQPDEWVELR